jgi:hypothetical protein
VVQLFRYCKGFKADAAELAVAAKTRIIYNSHAIMLDESLRQLLGKKCENMHPSLTVKAFKWIA